MKKIIMIVVSVLVVISIILVVAYFFFREPSLSEIKQGFTKYLVEEKGSTKLVVVETKEFFSFPLTTKAIVGSIGISTVEVSTWAHIEYYIDFEDQNAWSIEKRDKRLILSTPAIKVLPSSIMTDQIKGEIKDSSIFIDEQKFIEEAKKALPMWVAQQAGDPESIQKVKNQARDSLNKFFTGFLKKLNYKFDNIEIHIKD